MAESLVVGNDYSMLPRKTLVALEGNRVYLWGPYWVQEGGTIKDDVMLIDIAPRGAAQNLRAVIYADSGTANKFDVSRAAISRPTTIVAIGDEVRIAANAPPGRYKLPIKRTHPVDAYYWLGVWAGPVTAGNEVQIAYSAGGFGHHQNRSNSGTMNYASTGLPPLLTTVNATMSERREASIHFVIKPTDTTAPTLTLTADNDTTLLTIGRTDARTREYRIERSSDAGSTWGDVGVIACTGATDTFRDLTPSAAYRVSACYRSATAGSVTVIPTVARTQQAYATVNPIALPDTTGVYNPMRGVVNFDDSGQHITGATAYELYARSWVWNALQPTDPKTFNFDYGDRAIAKAVARGQRAWLRWRGYNTMGAGTLAPQWLIAAGLTKNGIPLWNNDAVIRHILNVFAALGTRYNSNDAVVAWDVGAVYRYGEWADGGDGGDISVANAKAIIAAACTAFSNKFVVVSLPDHTLDQAIRECLPLYANLHVRQDGIGGNFSPTALAEATFQAKVTGGKRSDATRAMLRGNDVPNGMNRSVSKHAESFSTSTSPGFIDPESQILTREDVTSLHLSSIADTNYNPFSTWSAAGKKALQDAARLAGYRYRVDEATVPTTFTNGTAVPIIAWWLNEGSAPCYEAWQPQYQLRTGATLIATADSSLFLRDIPQSNGVPRMHQDSITFADVPPGAYTLCVQVPRLNTSTPHLRLAHSEETSEQYTKLREVVVG